jgi:transposase
MQGRPRELPKELFKHDFVKLARKEKNARVKIRLLGLAHLQDGRSYKEVAELLKIEVSAPKRWIKRLAQGGVDNLQEQPGRGRRRWLSITQEQKFYKAVQALQGKRKGGRSRGKDIQNLLKEKFKINYAASSIYQVLHRCGLSWITGRSQHSKGNIEVQEAFKKTLLRK